MEIRSDSRSTSLLRLLRCFPGSARKGMLCVIHSTQHADSGSQGLLKPTKLFSWSALRARATLVARDRDRDRAMFRARLTSPAKVVVMLLIRVRFLHRKCDWLLLHVSPHYTHTHGQHHHAYCTTCRRHNDQDQTGAALLCSLCGLCSCQPSAAVSSSQWCLAQSWAGASIQHGGAQGPCKYACMGGCDVECGRSSEGDVLDEFAF
mmetsp:Transcript_41681/g.74793  ORF Transcript_41681/g.74793 Transcript_41681/m.74793 type:complete len:206 (+) Transcript_41681:1221-1838(+)